MRCFLRKNEFNNIIIAFQRPKINKADSLPEKFVNNYKFFCSYGLQTRIFRLRIWNNLDKMHKVKIMPKTQFRMKLRLLSGNDLGGAAAVFVLADNYLLIYTLFERLHMGDYAHKAAALGKPCKSAYSLLYGVVVK